MGNDNDKKKDENKLVYLLCPFCFLKIPTMVVYIENCVAKVELSCNCPQSQESPQILSLSEYIDKMRYRDELLINCSLHEKVTPSVFCVNCEKWLCDKCIKKEHSKQKCASEYNTVNYYPGRCKKHSINNLTFFCKKCKDLLCKTCQLEHTKVCENSSVKHKIVDYNTYITESKMENKFKKLGEYKKEDKILIESIKEHLDERIKRDNTSISEDTINKLEEAYNQNKEINEVLTEFIEIMFRNIQSLQMKEKEHKKLEITNKKVILNIIHNTSFNKIPEDIKRISEGKDNLNNDIEKFIRFLYTTYVTIKLNFKLTKIGEYSSNEQVSLVCMIDDNRIAISGETSINILNSKTVQRISSFSDHTSTVKSLHSMDSGNLVSSSNDRTIKYWDTQKIIQISKDIKSTKDESKKRQLRSQMQQYIKTLTLSTIPEMMIPLINSKDEVAFVGIEKNIEIWSFKTMKCEREKKLEGDYYFESIGQLKNGNILLGTENSIVVIKSKDLSIVKEIKGLEDEPKIFLELKNGNIVIGFRKIGFEIYDKNFYKIQSLFGHKNVVTGLIEMEDDILISTSNDTTLRIWDLKNYNCLEVVKMGKDEVTGLVRSGKDKIVVLKGEKNVDAWIIEKP